MYFRPFFFFLFFKNLLIPPTLSGPATCFVPPPILLLLFLSSLVDGSNSFFSFSLLVLPESLYPHRFAVYLTRVLCPLVACFLGVRFSTAKPGIFPAPRELCFLQCFFPTVPGVLLDNSSRGKLLLFPPVCLC